MTVDEAATQLGLSGDQVRRLCASRKLGHYRMGARRGKIVIMQADIDRYLASCRVDPDTEPRAIEPPRSQKLSVPDRIGELMRARRQSAPHAMKRQGGSI